MNFRKHSICLIIVLVLLLSSTAFSQNPDSLSIYNPGAYNLKPRMNYSLGSSVTVFPHIGTITGVTISPFLSVPLSPRLSVDAGFIAGRYYSTIPAFNPEGQTFGTFNQLSVYGSASYRINPQLTIYGSGIKSLVNSSPLNLLPKSSYTLGTSYNFGSFTLGASIHVAKWDNSMLPLPVFPPRE